MKFPALPPDDDKITDKAFDGRWGRTIPDQLSAILEQLPYEHWDKMRFRPVPKPFLAEDLWAIAKLRRRFVRRRLLLRDKRDTSFSYVPIGEFQRALHEIDSN